MDVTNLQFNFLTWNATGIMSSASYLCECLKHKNIDICGISEHWLYEKDLQFLKQIDNSFMCHAVSDFDLKRPSRRGVGKGGVAILWHKKDDKYVIPLSLDDDRVIGIKFEINRDNSTFLFQVYLPCTNHPIDMFKEYLDRLQNILSLYSEKGTVVLMGDFNAYLPIACFRERADHRSLYLQSFVPDNNMLSLYTSELCTGANLTFVTYDGRYESLIDYILTPVEKMKNVTLQNQIDGLDRVAEIDSVHFWRLVNARRKTSNSSPRTELIFNGQTFNTSKEINKEWAHYFRDLYTPTQNKNFDSNFYDLVSNEIRRIEINLENSRESLSYPIISPDEVGSAIKMTHSNKDGGDDEIVCEYIKYGGTILLEILSK